MTAKEIEFQANMTPEQLNFNKEMLSFLALLGVDYERLEQLCEFAKTQKDFTAKLNANFTAIQQDLKAISDRLKMVEDKVNGVSYGRGRTVLDDLMRGQEEIH